MAEAAPHLLDLHPRSWPEEFVRLGGKAFHGRSAANWIFRRLAPSWEAMSDLPAALRVRLSEEHPFPRSSLRARSEAGDGAVKVLLSLPDGATVEAVTMPGTSGLTACLSTQVGCPVRCAFCASGLEGLERNLSSGEIVEQALWLAREAGAIGRIVIMGMGDAGHNLEATLAAIDALIDEEGMNIAARRVTLSTVGPKGALERIAQWGRQVTLALSVHAPDDALRHELVPGVRKRTLAETLSEADALFSATGREYTVEYVLLEGVNDSPEQARALGGLLRRRRCHVNLIPWNPVDGMGFQRPPRERQEAFAETLRDTGVSVTLRRSLGRETDAACGQLRRRSLPAGPDPLTV
ncbi:MAG: 23S rRNA (adenine(2503)-C(2))-methyltransferase RlmN [Planctomycetota bacterium]|nr:23S rRNA (adenine(2503)-C(2))-methyltransferase RlmN [Planctomycetota bacterium]